MHRRHFIALALAAGAGRAGAQAYPARPIRVIIPATPGGGTDFLGRLVCTKLAEANGWQMVPENRPGAGTALGLAEAARSSPAGYDLVVAQTDNVSLIPLLLKVAYDPLKDLTPIALLATTPMVIVVPAASPYRTLADFVRAAKAEPGKLTYGTSGTGGSAHVSIELLQIAAGIRALHVPYKGSAPAIADLVGGHLQFSGTSISSASSLIAAGKIRALAVTSGKRSAALPGVPTVSESGYPDFTFSTYYGLMAPAGLPAPVLARLNADVEKMPQRPDTRAALAGQGLEPGHGSPEDFAALIRADIQKARDVIAAANIKVE